MLIKAGYDISFHCPSSTSMLLLLSVHPSREKDLHTRDVVETDPYLPTSDYIDLFGNRVTRVEVPAGDVSFRNSFTIEDSGLLDEVPDDAPLDSVARLPNDVLTFLLPSRYCDSDKLSDFAWSKFAGIYGGARLAQAICEFAHGHIHFDYQRADPMRTASAGLSERVGVCRDFAHLAISLTRAMNIPARYCTGYLGDIGVPKDPAPMDFSAWYEVFLNGRWYTFDARHNSPRIGRIVMAKGRDAADVAISTSFGPARLNKFTVMTDELVMA